ncbi:MAG: hypothetical protein WA667_21860 [Candidatus Nitrosopolaris sp.]
MSNRILLPPIIIAIFALSMILINPAKAYITQNSHLYGNLDVNNKCDVNTNSSNSCFNLGIKGGLIDGNQSRGQLGYSLIDGCDAAHSANYCAGYILGYNKGYGHQTNNTEILSIANKTGGQKGFQHGAAPPQQILCTVSTLFCSAYLHGYTLEYEHGIPWWIGHDDGEKQADADIKNCHEQNNPTSLGHHTQAYRNGFGIGYTDETGDATNDDGTYGGNHCRS